MTAPWSRQEVDEVVADYLEMLESELKGEDFTKASHIRHVVGLVDDRTPQSVQYKYGNVSAVLRDLGLPFVDGFKPYRNYQQLLFEVVGARVAERPGLLGLIRDQVEEQAALPEVEDILDALVPPPSRTDDEHRPGRVKAPFVGPMRPVDYLEREARNQSLGSAGEEFVLRFEQARLHAAGRSSLAERVERISATQGDWLGFDIKSYERDGTDRLIEVKTTRYGSRTPFYVSRNEVEVSIEREPDYHLARVFRFREKPSLFVLPGRLDRSCELDPVTFIAKAG